MQYLTHRWSMFLVFISPHRGLLYLLGVGKKLEPCSIVSVYEFENRDTTRPIAQLDPAWLCMFVMQLLL